MAETNIPMVLRLGIHLFIVHYQTKCDHWKIWKRLKWWAASECPV